MWSMVVLIVSRLTLVDWVFLFGVLLAALYVYGTWNYDFADRRGLPGLRPPVPYFGNINWRAVFGKTSSMNAIKELYNKGAGHPVLVFYGLRNPIIMIRDPDVIRHIAVKEFDHFTNRQRVKHAAHSFANKNLVALRDNNWREMRATLSPAFTSSKLKSMFSLISECGRQLADYIEKEHSKGRSTDHIKLDSKDLFTRYANDVIATAAFGVGCDSLKQPENEFYLMCKDLTTPNFKRIILLIGFLIFPRIVTVLIKMFFIPKSLTFFESLVKETMEEREKKGIYRPDVLHLLMQARKGELQTEAEDKEDEHEIKGEKIRLGDEDVSAQAILFFFAGFETVSMSLAFVTYALASYPDVQNRLQKEVDDVMERTGGKLTYEAVVSMKYLDMVICEALRLYPPGTVTDRECGSPCSIPAGPGRGIIRFEKDDLLWIPMYGIHTDPHYWRDPDHFDPERFNDENKSKIKPFTYMPFGMGPRVCIGQRFAVLEMKIALIYLMAHFELSRPGGPAPVIEYAKGLLIKPEGGYDTLFSPRRKI